jgi:TetR/AcrR family transcriptional regulator, lmrAB and yxaGH operons repressor
LVYLFAGGYTMMNRSVYYLWRRGDAMKVNGPRERLLLSAIALMCERGVHATGLADLLAHSHTARASIYQHFPGGKTELMEQATYAAGRTITALVDNLLATHDVTGVIDGVIEYWKQVLTGSDYAMGCPILAAAQSGPTEPGVQAASAAIFAAWTDKLAGTLGDAGVDPVTSRSIASAAVSSIEGAIAQSRSARTTQPLDDVRIALTHLIESAKPARHR